MAKMYAYRMVTFAQQQFDSLSRAGKAAVVKAIMEVRRDPEIGSFSRQSHTWMHSTTDVVLQYTVEHNLVMVTIFRMVTDK